MLLAEFGTGQVVWSMLWFFLWVIWLWLLIVVFGDIFRSPDLSGWQQAMWTVFVVVLPYLGVLVYLIARGSTMQDRAAQAAQANDAALRQDVQQVTAPGTGSPADEIARLADLRAEGVIDEADVQRAKAKALA